MKKATPKLRAAEPVAGADASAALIDAARDIFLTEGVKGLSLRRVAEKAGCTTMAVYSRFKGKDGILGALYDEGFERLLMAQLAIDPSLKDQDRILAFCQAYRAVAQAYPHHYALMLGHFSGELSPSQDSQVKALATLDNLSEAVAEMPEMKGARQSASSEIANRLFAFCHGWVSLEQMEFFGERKDVDKQFDAAVLALLRLTAKS